jgi:hypothetical protein
MEQLVGRGMSQILKAIFFPFPFSPFFLLSYLYLFEVQSVPWYAIKKRLKKASRIVRQSDVGTTKKMGMQQ